AELSRLIEQEAAPLVEAYAERGTKLTNELKNITQTSTEQLEVQSTALVDALNSRTRETLEAIESAGSSLKTEVTDLIAKLGQSNASISSLVTDTATTLQEVDTRLSDTTERFADRAGQAADKFATSTDVLQSNLTHLDAISNNTLDRVSSIAGSFDDHSKMLSSASDLLSSAQSSLVSTLEERKDALEDLSSGLVTRSEEIQQTMRSVETIVDEAFGKARDRAGDSARELSGSLSSSIEKIENLLSDTEIRSASTADMLKESIREAVEDAVNRFSGATDEIRQSANAIRDELSETRTEIKKGVFDLPEETRESTSAMRKAVADQIKALQDLSSIVQQSSHVLDHSSPQGKTATAEPKAEPVEEKAPPKPAATTAKPEPVMPAATPPPDIDLRGGLSVSPSGDQLSDDRKQQSEGWVRDLLRSASLKEDSGETPTRSSGAAPASNARARNPRQMVESLNSLSVDIARAIDHDASVELWRRYQSGERDVFTRRLYTLKGQKTFEEIKNKYAQEPEFRTAVDHYIADFEKLLTDVAKNDRDQVVTQTYLTSDTGKVYTMLAHASGRLK
ncbi:MAG: hypothetical protein AAGC96_14845, partial [Pseudomonadota bacterium]